MLRQIITMAILILIVVLVYSIPAGSEEKSSTEVKKVTMAVFDFKIAAETGKTIVKSERGTWSVETQKETSVLTDKFITALIKTNKIKIVERDKLDTVMKEFALTQAGITSPEHSQKIGKLLGADYLLHGSISMFDADIKHTAIPYTDNFNKIIMAQMAVDIRLVKTETGQIVTAETTNERIEKKEIVAQKQWDKEFPQGIIEELLRKTVNSLVNSIIDEIYPIKVASIKDDILYLNRGEGGNLNKGDKLRVILLGEEIRDPDTNSVIGFEDTEIAVIEVVEVLSKLTKAKVVQWKGDSKEIPKQAICRRAKEENKESKEIAPQKEKTKLPGTGD